MWADAVHKYLFTDGLLTAAPRQPFTRRLSQQIDRAIVGQSLFAGAIIAATSNDNGPGTGMWQPPAFLYTRNGLANSSYLLAGNTTTLFNNADDPNYPSDTPDTWIGNQNRMFNTYFPVRTANVLAEFQAAGVYPTSQAAPEFSGLPTGGDLTGPLTVTNPSGVGTIYYTTDGSDPRVTPNVPSPILAAGIPFVRHARYRSAAPPPRSACPKTGDANGQTVCNQLARRRRTTTAIS